MGKKGVHERISVSLGTLSGEDRAKELEARLQAHRSPRASQGENQRRLELTHKDQGREMLHQNFLASSRRSVERSLNLTLTHSEYAEQKRKGFDYSGTSSERLLKLQGRNREVERDVVQAIATKTGIMSVDHFLGGGLPSGFTEIYGPESVGKTSMLAQIIKSSQEMGKQVALTSTEYFDAPYFARNGVDLSRLLMLRSKSGEIALESAYHLLRSSANVVYIIDPATGLRPPNDTYDHWVWMIAEWMEEVANIMEAGSAVVMANQVRVKKSVDPGRIFAGGTDSVARKIAGMFSTRIELSRTAVTEETYDMVVHIVANTLKPPAKIFDIPFVKGEGIDVCRDLVRVAASVGALEQSGSWYRWQGEVIGQGETETARYLEGAHWTRESLVETTLRALARG